LEATFRIGKIEIPKRILVPFFIVLMAKITGAVFIYYSLNISSAGTFWSDPNRVYDWVQNNVFLTNFGGEEKWALTFLGWDSAWYLNILTNGYSFSVQSYTFSPMFSFFGALTNLLLQNSAGSLVLTALIFGVLWIPIYQLLAENYIGKTAALLSTILLAFSPYLFVFTTVAYSEGLFLFFVLTAWLLFKKGKLLGATAFAIIAPLTRIMGIIVVFPMLYWSLKQKANRIRNVILCLLPVASLIGWFVSLGIFTGDYLAPAHTSEWQGLYSFRTLLTQGIPQYGIQAILDAPLQLPPITSHWLLPFAVIFALFFPLFMLYSIWKIDKPLWIYALAGYVGILFFGALVSTPRFVAVLFPLWIPLTARLSGSKKSLIITAVAAGTFFVVALDLWISFLNGEFIA
jgi:hypothetical protein